MFASNPRGRSYLRTELNSDEVDLGDGDSGNEQNTMGVYLEALRCSSQARVQELQEIGNNANNACLDNVVAVLLNTSP